MRADVLIVGQGLAGTVLAWALEWAGISFVVADSGHAGATLAGAGIVNPITGRRLVKSGRFDDLLPLARGVYARIGDELGVALWKDMRVRRLFADERERAVHAAKLARGELAPFASAADEAGFWIDGAARVDLGQLVSESRARWLRRGNLRSDVIDLRVVAEHHALTIDCSGWSGAKRGHGFFAEVPWEFSKGELLELAVPKLEPGVILNRGEWLLPTAPGCACVGATHEPGVCDPTATAGARLRLEAKARELLASRAFTVTGQRAGIRVNLPDKRPVVGRSGRSENIGTINGLGAKGVLWAPFLARQWVEHLAAGATFDAEVDVRRFVR